jgi:hypothetical protein
MASAIGTMTEESPKSAIKVRRLKKAPEQSIMTRKLHPSARTNPRLRREIQQSAESNRALASWLGLNEKTVAKWKRRGTTSDARKGPKQRVSTVLDVVEEALIVVFRKRTRLPVDDCLVCLKPMIPALSRSALHRCLKRYGVSRIPKGWAKKLPAMKGRIDPGHFTIEIHAVPDETGESYLYTAISSLSRFVFASLLEEVNAHNAVRFLAELIKHAPFKVSRIETNSHAAFGNPNGSLQDPEHPSMFHPFSKACRDNDIIRLVAKSRNPAPKTVSKGWAGVPRWSSSPMLSFEFPD